MAKLKVYGTTLHSTRVERGGNGARQARAIVATTTKKAAAEAFDITMHTFNQYAGETGNPVELEVALSEPGVVFVAKHTAHRKTVEDFQRVLDGERP